MLKGLNTFIKNATNGKLYIDEATKSVKSLDAQWDGTLPANEIITTLYNMLAPNKYYFLGMYMSPFIENFDRGMLEYGALKQFIITKVMESEAYDANVFVPTKRYDANVSIQTFTTEQQKIISLTTTPNILLGAVNNPAGLANWIANMFDSLETSKNLIYNETFTDLFRDSEKTIKNVYPMYPKVNGESNESYILRCVVEMISLAKSMTQPSKELTDYNNAGLTRAQNTQTTGTIDARRNLTITRENELCALIEAKNINKIAVATKRTSFRIDGMDLNSIRIIVVPNGTLSQNSSTVYKIVIGDRTKLFNIFTRFNTLMTNTYAPNATMLYVIHLWLVAGFLDVANGAVIQIDKASLDAIGSPTTTQLAQAQEELVKNDKNITNR